jgi:hypothetical protein
MKSSGAKQKEAAKAGASPLPDREIFEVERVRF